MERNPAQGVRFMKPKRVSRTLGFSDEEVRRMLEAPDPHSRSGAAHAAILHFLFYCGLRRSEVCMIRTSQITTERGHVVLRLRGKGDHERIIPLTPPVVEALGRHFRMNRKDPAVDQFLFTPSKNPRSGVLDKPLDSSAIFYIVKTYSKAVGIQSRVSPHSCRATAISNARDHQVSDRAIQEFAGWASTDMITRYDKRRTAIEKSAAFAVNYEEDAPERGKN
jgi:integrase